MAHSKLVLYLKIFAIKFQSIHVVQPDFSTTTVIDVTVASIIMMATLQNYFSYKFTLDCGIPSISLLGMPDDWQTIRARVDEFEKFGDEPKKWAAMLRPVCDAFVSCFDQRDLDNSCVYILARGTRTTGSH